MSKRPPNDERERLSQLINQWNSEHLDLFTLTQPNEDLEFDGVIRFYFKDSAAKGAKVSTKCVRVSSTASTGEVIDVLVEKFRPDMRMLAPGGYLLYEVHVNMEERQLLDGEKPLFVQLNWGKDVREGRFLLKRENDNREADIFDEGNRNSLDAGHTDPVKPGSFRRKLSRREKKAEKKAEKGRIRNKENHDSTMAEKHYNELPETSFTRSISNPELVMKRRRQQKLEKKLEQIHAQEGPHSAGTLKIYGESLNTHVPYKTLLLSASDTTNHVIRETMEKYGVGDEPAENFCLVQVLVDQNDREYHGGQMGQQRILEPDECPLAIAMAHPPARGTLIFEIRRSAVEQKLRAKQMRAHSHEDVRTAAKKREKQGRLEHLDIVPKQFQQLPFLVELGPDGAENPHGVQHHLKVSVTNVGSDKNLMRNGNALVIPDGSIQPHHCLIAHTEDGIVTITPKSPNAETFIEGQPIVETTMLEDGMVVSFGRFNKFLFHHPGSSAKRQQPLMNEPLSHMKKQKFNDGRQPQQQQQQQQQQLQPNYETNFDVDGHIETVTDKPAQQMNRSFDKRPVEQQSGVLEDALPVALEFPEKAEENFLMAIIQEANPANINFKLASTYALYIAVRYRLSTAYHPELTPVERAKELTSMVDKIATITHRTIQMHHENPAAMAFWMANASELLHFFMRDHDVNPFSTNAQELLAECVQMAFHHLVKCLQYDLQEYLPAFLDESELADEIDTGDGHGRANLGDILNTLSSAMHLLRRCRVNAALTIQLFSQLFHFINMWLFNTLATQPQMRLCTRAWGRRLKQRLSHIQAWAEKQGLELAADCHLLRITQAAHLLQMPLNSLDDVRVAEICSDCFKLNPLQLRTLLKNYVPDPGMPPVPQSLIDKVVAVSANTADELTRPEGQQMFKLEEDQDLQLPFLLPENKYSCDFITGVPNGLLEFLDPLARAGLCQVMVQQEARGDWTVYLTPSTEDGFLETVRQKSPPSSPMAPAAGDGPHNTSGHNLSAAGVPPGLASKEPEIIRVTFSKIKGSLGLSIVAAKGEGQPENGIYIKSVVPGGAAAKDSRLQAGDQILECDGRRLFGLSQEEAAKQMMRTGQTVALKVYKQAAVYHGLAKLLSQPSPTLTRAGGHTPNKQMGPPASPQHGRQRPELRHQPRSEEAPPPYQPHPSPQPTRQDRREPGYGHDDIDPRYQSLPQGPHTKSSPALHHNQSSPADYPRATSTTNIPAGYRNKQYSPTGPQPHTPQQHDQNFRTPDSRSKSTSNLQQDEDRDPGRHVTPQSVRPAASTSMIAQREAFDPRSPRGAEMVNRGAVPPQHHHQQSQVQPQEYGINNYENSAQIERERQPRNELNDSMRSGSHGSNHSYPTNRGDDSGYSNNRMVVASQQPQRDVVPLQQSQQHQLQGPDKRTSTSSSSSNARDERPKSAYIQQQIRPEQSQSRPRSEEFDRNKVHEWQERNRHHSPAGPPQDTYTAQNQNLDVGPRIQPPVQLSPPSSPQTKSFIQYPSEQATVTLSRPPATQVQDIPRGYPQDNRQQHANFYENTVPKQEMAPPPFHQLAQTPEKPRPAPPAKPSTAPKPNRGSAHFSQADIPLETVDYRASQPAFYNNTTSNYPRSTDPRNVSIQQPPQQQQQQHPPNMSQAGDPRIHQSQSLVGPAQPHHQRTSYPYGEPPHSAHGHHNQLPQQQAHLPHGEYYGVPAQEQSMELPPPPALDVEEGAPPLPPPPQHLAQDPPPPVSINQIRLEKQIEEEKQRMLRGLDPRYSTGMSTGGVLTDPNRDIRKPAQQQETAQQQQDHSRNMQSDTGQYPQHQQQGYYENGRYSHEAPPVDEQTLYYPSPDASMNNDPHNYQNINRFREEGAGDRPTYESQQAEQQQPQQPQHNVHQNNRYNPNVYDARSTVVNGPTVTPPSQQPQFHQQQHPQQNSLYTVDVNLRSLPQSQSSVPPATSSSLPRLQVKDEPEPRTSISPSVWERDSREKEQNGHMGLKSNIEREIAELEAFPYLGPQDQERLRRLQLELEFQRRLEESEKHSDDDSDNDESAERIMSRELIFQKLNEDFAKSKKRAEEAQHSQMTKEYDEEMERLDRLTRRMEIFEKDRREAKERQQKRSEHKQRVQEEKQRKQREHREQQRADYEQNKKILLQEDERLKLRREEDLRRKREHEREQLREMQVVREAEEVAARAEVRRQEEEQSRQRVAEQERRRLEAQRQVRVGDERQRLDNISGPQDASRPPTGLYRPRPPTQLNTSNPNAPPMGYKNHLEQFGFQQLPPSPDRKHPPQQTSLDSSFPPPPADLNNPAMMVAPAPPPPERNSSYNFTQRVIGSNNEGIPVSDSQSEYPAYANSSVYRGPPPPMANSSIRPSTSAPESLQQQQQFQANVPTPKKSVSFNSQLETRINTYSVSESEGGSPYQSYRSSTSSNDAQSPGYASYEMNNSTPVSRPSTSDNEVFNSTPQQNNVQYTTAQETPTVIGAQEIYRDPRARIQARNANNATENAGQEKKTFRDKMKFFATEAGELTPKDRAKSSRVQRNIESQLINGQ